ncbi:MAG: hypothetical protein ACXVDN_21530 [Ktedonobacteraceae bacterium]
MEPGPPDTTPAEVLHEVRNLFHTYPDLHATCGMPIAVAAVELFMVPFVLYAAQRSIPM